jgi:hypothetical protein
LRLSPELHRDPRTGGNMRSSGRRLLAGYAAAYGFQIQSNVLSSFDGAAHGLPHERRDFDATLLDVEDDRPRGWQVFR